jgi:uncharacterized protein
LRAGAAEAFAGTPVRFAYLFGSYATGLAGRRSGVDVAVHLGGTTVDTTLLLGLGRRLDAVTGAPTDVLVLDTATLRVAGRVLRDGRLVFSVDEVARVRYESTTRKLAADFAIHADALDRALLRDIGAGRR